MGDGPQPTWAISQEAVDRGIKRLPLPYFVNTSPPGPFIHFLQKAARQAGAPTTCEWADPVSIVPDNQFQNTLEEDLRAALEDEFDLASHVDCRAAMAFLLNPVDVQTVHAIASAGLRMPQKSTDFYPKLLTGLVWHRIAGVSGSETRP